MPKGESSMTCGTGPWRNVCSEKSPRSAEDPPAMETTLTVVCPRASPAQVSPRTTPTAKRCRAARTHHALRNHAEFMRIFLLVETSHHHGDRTERITLTGYVVPAPCEGMMLASWKKW